MKFEFDDAMTMSEIHELVFKECEYWQGKRQQQQTGTKIKKQKNAMMLNLRV